MSASAHAGVRPAAVAGLFYPEEAVFLKKEVCRFLAMGQAALSQNDVFSANGGSHLRGLIVPHAGYMYSGKTAGRAYAELARLEHKPRRVILLGPAHRVYVPFISVAAVAAYQTPLGLAPVAEATHELAERFGFVPEVHRQEHALEVQLPFLQTVLPNAEYIPIVVGGADPRQLADVLRPYLDDETLLLVSTDLSHFLTDAQARQVDQLSSRCIAELDVQGFMQRGDACGKIGVLTAMILAQTRHWSSYYLDYTNSSEASGDRARVVGYGAYAMGETK